MTKPDQWKGRQMYPRDTVSSKKLDRLSDRLDRRIDHGKEVMQAKIVSLNERIAALEAAHRHLHVLVSPPPPED